jgi:hypothetical protein
VNGVPNKLELKKFLHSGGAFSQAFILSFCCTLLFQGAQDFVASSTINFFLFLLFFFFHVVSGQVASALSYFVFYLSSLLILGQFAYQIGFRFDSLFITCSYTLLAFASSLKFRKVHNVEARRFSQLHLGIFLIAPLALFKKFGSDANLATFLTGWDHTGGHLYVISVIKKLGTFSYFPADYVGSAPKLFHQFTALFVNQQTISEAYFIILFLEFFFCYTMSLALVNIVSNHLKIWGGLKSKSGRFTGAFSFAVIPFFGPFFAWSLGFGYPTILLALTIFLCTSVLIADSASRGGHVRLGLIILIALVGNTWNPALPAAFLVFVYFHVMEIRRIGLLLCDSFLALATIALPVISIYVNAGVGAASMGSTTFSILLLFWLCFSACISIYSLIVGRKPMVAFLGSFVLGNVIFALIVKLLSKSAFGEFPYYAVKILWISTIPTLLLCSFFILEKWKWVFLKPLSSFVLSILILVCSNIFHLFPDKNNGITIFKPINVNLIWQTTAIDKASEFDPAQSLLIYSGSGWDSRSAQFLSVLGYSTWNSQSALIGDETALCRFALENPKLLIIARSSTTFPDCLIGSRKIFVE